MYYTIHEGNGNMYTALAKRTPFTNGHPIFEPGDIWFEIGGTKEEVLSGLKKSLPDNDWIKWEKT